MVGPVAVATGAGAGAVVREVVPVRLCERVLMIDEVLVRAMVEWFQSKGVGVYSCGINKATE